MWGCTSLNKHFPYTHSYRSIFMWEWWGIDESLTSKSKILIDLFFINMYVNISLVSYIFRIIQSFWNLDHESVQSNFIFKELFVEREHKINRICWKERRFIWRMHSSLIIIIMISKYKRRKSWKKEWFDERESKPNQKV